ncbi:hypothetical protein BC628DRAFT_1308202, partial [Trametes gibbosa]
SAPHPTQGGKSPAAIASLMKRKRSPEEPSDDEEDEEDDQISDDDKDVEPRRQQRKRIAVGNNNDEDEDMEIDNELGQAKQSDNSEASRGMKLSLHEVALPADAPEPSQTGPEWFQAKDADREAVISSYEDAFTAGANPYLQAGNYQVLSLFESVYKTFGEDKEHWDLALEELKAFVDEKKSDMAQGGDKE